MNKSTAICLLLICFLGGYSSYAQIVINEGSNRNLNTLADEDNSYEDWLELYNPGTSAVNLAGYSLSDDSANLSMWTFNEYWLQPGEFLIVFLSDKNRFYSEGFQEVSYITDYIPHLGWNYHVFDTPFIWDGVSDIIVNSCSYNASGYYSNSVFNQTEPGYACSTVAYNDGNDASCSALAGEVHAMRPNLRLNNVQIGEGVATNGGTWYPAPYGNWYWSARNQMLYKADELIAAGLTAGPIDSLGWDVAYTDGEYYNYIRISMKQMLLPEMNSNFVIDGSGYYHTNFKLQSNGEYVYLTSPVGELIQTIDIDALDHTASVGSFPDGSADALHLAPPTPGYSNGSSMASLTQAAAPVFSLSDGVYDEVQHLIIYELNGDNAITRYTLDGSEPDSSSAIFELGSELTIFQSAVVRARSYVEGQLPSDVVSLSCMVGVNHETPILSVAIDPDFLYGANGVFDNWQYDWEKYAQVSYFDSTQNHPLLFSKPVVLQIDGGAGGSRAHPQHSFRLEFDRNVIAGQPVQQELMPADRPGRNEFSKLYFRNGSNMWMALPYKDACGVELLCRNTMNYYSAMRPVSVYINGQYFGLYEMREKFDEEFYQLLDGSNPDSMDILSMSYWYNLVLRAVTGDADHYWNSLDQYFQLDAAQENFLSAAEQHFDMKYLADYIIAESWIGNVDWPGNNIKIYRGDSTENRWRFAVVDVELSLRPGGWTDCGLSGIQHVMDHGPDHPYVGPWIRAMNNESYRNYSLVRLCDLLNTQYSSERVESIENNHFNRWVLEMPNEYQRWGDPWNVNGQMNSFYQNHLDYQSDLICRSETVRNEYRSVFGLQDDFVLELAVEPPGAGYIRLNTISPQEYPWTGLYYKNIPITLQAIANPGYSFVNWSESSFIDDVLNPQMNTTIGANEASFTAYFMEDDIVTDVSESMATVKIFPNPANDIIAFDADANYSTVEISDLTGKVVLNCRRVNGGGVDVSSLPKGVYMVVLRDASGSCKVSRFCKQ